MQNNVIENRIRLKPYYFAYMDILGAKKYIESENYIFEHFNITIINYLILQSFS